MHKINVATRYAKQLVPGLQFKFGNITIDTLSFAMWQTQSFEFIVIIRKNTAKNTWSCGKFLVGLKGESSTGGGGEGQLLLTSMIERSSKRILFLFKLLGTCKSTKHQIAVLNRCLKSARLKSSWIGNIFTKWEVTFQLVNSNSC